MYSTERCTRQAAIWQAIEIQRTRARAKAIKQADRIWTIRINSGGLKRTANAKIIQIKGV